jgi:hypothetical protein
MVDWSTFWGKLMRIEPSFLSQKASKTRLGMTIIVASLSSLKLSSSSIFSCMKRSISSAEGPVGTSKFLKIVGYYFYKYFKRLVIKYYISVLLVENPFFFLMV